MHQQITVEEKYSEYWTATAFSMAILSIILFYFYSTIEDLLWKGYMRLAAFAGLTATVFSALKVMQGKHTINLEIRNDHVLLSYRRNSKEVGKDLFELRNIEYLQVKDRLSGAFGTSFLFNDRILKLKLSDSERPLNLVEVDGRALSLYEEDARRILEFISEHARDANILEPGDG